MTWSRATAIAGSAVVTLASCRIQIVRGDIENRPKTSGRWRLAPAGCGQHDKGSGVTSALMAAFSPQECASYCSHAGYASK
jgi:hypothetical protein